jgi:hypothetical protein
MLLSVCALVAVTARVSAQGQQGAAQTPPAGGQGQGRGGAPTNVQVLPKDWTRQQVMAFMRNFTTGLGVMCTDCHVQDRASDEKKEKVTARQMLKMAMAINNDFLKDVGEPPAAGTMKVTCYTCHRGQRKPLNAPPSGGGGN